MQEEIDVTSGCQAGTPGWVWPAWACTARIAGAYFHPTEVAAELDARLDRLAAQHVTVVLADSPWGQQYAVWADDERFREVRELMALVVRHAHARGLKVVMYQTGLELLSDRERNPGLEHPEWAQHSLAGDPVLFDDVTVEEQHWLERGIWDFWVTPCGAERAGGSAIASFREVSLSRVREMVGTGIDGLWVDEVYLQSSVGSHHDLWPSADPCAAEAFRSATGLPVPRAADWDDAIFRRWVVWRHCLIADFLLGERDAARAINPNIVFINENSDLDTGRSTYVANDPTFYRVYPDISTGHEVEVVSDRMDLGETGMKHATLDQWLAFRTMVAFARAADPDKPSWILTYGYEPRDSAQLAGLVLTEGGNFYETRGPQMADSVSHRFRTELFGWIARHESAFYSSESIARVGLLYSPRTRDLVDTIWGQPYDPTGSVHFAAYRAAANALYRAHVPFDVVIDTNTAAFDRYDVLLVPEVQAMSDVTAIALRQFPGVLVIIGNSGLYDEWRNERPVGALVGVEQRHFASVGPEMLALANTGLLTTRAPATVQMGLRQCVQGYSLVLVNLGPGTMPALQVSLQLAGGKRVRSARLATLGGTDQATPFMLRGPGLTVSLQVSAGIDTVGLLTLLTDGN